MSLYIAASKKTLISKIQNFSIKIDKLNKNPNYKNIARIFLLAQVNY